MQNNLDLKSWAIIILTIITVISIGSIFFFKKSFYKEGRIDGINEKLDVAVESLEMAIDEKYKDKNYVNKYVKSIKIKNSDVQYALDKKFSTLEEFDKTLKLINTKGIEIMATVHDLKKSDRKLLYSIYDTLHQKSVEDEYNAFIKLKDKKILDSYESVVKREYYNTSKAISEYLANNTCSSITKVLSIGSLTAKSIDLTTILISEPCKILLESLIKPFETELIALGIGMDYDKAVHRIKNHVRTSVLELSTVSDDQTSTQYVEKEAGSWIGKIFSGKAKLSVSYVGRVKAGYKLDEYFEVKFDHNKEKLQLFLPEPTILSTEVHTNIHNLEEDWSGFIEIDPSTINYYSQLAREEIVNKALTNNLYSDAEKNAATYLGTLFMPFYSLPDKEYKLEIYFENKMYERKVLLD